MPGALQPQYFAAYQIFNTQIPSDGPKALTVLVDFTQQQPIQIDLTLPAIDGKIPFVQAVFIDNSQNPNPIVLTVEVTQQRIQVPSGQQGWYAIAAGRPPVFSVTCVGGSTSTLFVFSSVPIPTSQWQAGSLAGQIYLTKPAILTPLGYQQIVGLVAATNLTPPTGATYAFITVETQSVRWRDDGTAPTIAIGMLEASGSSPPRLNPYSGNLSAIQFIQTAATATLDISYYK